MMRYVIKYGSSVKGVRALRQSLIGLWLVGSVVFAEIGSHRGYIAVAQQVVAFAGASHASGLAFDDTLAERAFDNLLEWFDRDRIYLTQADYEQLAARRSFLDDELSRGDLSFIDTLLAIMRERSRERLSQGHALLSSEVSFDESEQYTLSVTGFLPAAAIGARLRQWMKMRALETLENSSESSLQGALKEAASELAITDVFLMQLQKEELFEVYMTAVLSAWDRRSSFLSAYSFHRFQARVYGTSYGIGLEISIEPDGSFVITAITEGSPAEHTGKLLAGDRILGVSRDGSRSKMQTTQGLSLAALGALIDDDPSTGVMVRIERHSETFDVLVSRTGPRKEPSALWAGVVSTKIDRTSLRIGLIHLAVFYDDGQGGSCVQAIRTLLEHSEFQNLDALVIDLRNNTGGGLEAAINMAGLFIDEGPVVQIRARGETELLFDHAKGAVYEGPMVVLTNELSASAAELFTGAMKDYGRALLVGDAKTFGKGSVQGIFSLDRVLEGPLAFMGVTTQDAQGAVKLTLAQFYRLNGETAQGKGVTPDIVLPSFVSGASGEASFGPDRIAAVQIAKAATISPQVIERLSQQSQIRQSGSAMFQRSQELITQCRRLAQRSSVSLNRSTRERDYALGVNCRLYGEKDQNRHQFDEADYYDQEIIQIATDYARELKRPQPGVAGRATAP